MDWNVIVMIAGVGASFGAAFYARSQAAAAHQQVDAAHQQIKAAQQQANAASKTATEQATIGRIAAQASASQAESSYVAAQATLRLANTASSAAEAAVSQAKSARKQIRIMHEQLLAEMEDRDERAGPIFGLTAGKLFASSTVEPADNPLGQVTDVRARTVRIKWTGGPDEMLLVVRITRTDPPNIPARINADEGTTYRLVRDAPLDVEVIVPNDWGDTEFVIAVELVATEVGARKRTWVRRQAVAFARSRWEAL